MISKSFLLGKKGQFFSPDMIIAIFIFVVAISFFFISSENIYQQIALFEERKKIDEIAHSTMNFLVYSQGVPNNWEYYSLDDINFFGLVKERNVLSEKKLSALLNYLDQNYLLSKEKLGLSSFNFKLLIIDSENNIIFSKGSGNENSKNVLKYDRVVIYNNELAIMRGEFSSAN